MAGKIYARRRFIDVCLDAQIPAGIRKHLTFYRLHFAYFFILIFLGTFILYTAHRSDAAERHFSFVDCIFNIVSVVTVTGLTTVRIAAFSLFDRFLLLVLMILGSPVVTSLLPLYVRRFYFYSYHLKHVKHNVMETATHGPKLETPRFAPADYPGADYDDHADQTRCPKISHLPARWGSSIVFGSPTQNGGCQLSRQNLPLANGDTRDQRFSITMDVVKAFDSKLGHRNLRDLFDGTEDRVLDDGLQYEAGSLPRVRSLQSEPLDVMKSIEHQGLVVLSWVVPIYMTSVLILSFALSLFILSLSPHALQLLKERNLNSAFFSFLSSVSAFTNSGIPVNDDNLVPFQSQLMLLLLYTLVSLLGNILYPPCLRLIISILHLFSAESRRPTYSYLLNHPRRCFTHMFPQKQSIWLCFTVIGFTLFQLIFFCILNWNSKALAGLNAASKVVDGIYQSVSVRNAGGSVVNTAQLASTMLVLYVFMMFIASYPVALLRQNSTEYDNGEMGIYRKRWEETLTDNSITFQARNLLAKDSAYLCVTLFLICLIESGKIGADPLNYSIFNIIFEIVSAYGGVGMSIGYSCGLRLPTLGDHGLGSCTDVPYSFSGKWNPWGRIILAVVMLIGRHRGLPDDIDSALKLPCFSEPWRPSSHAGSVNRSFTSLLATPARSLEDNSLEDGQQTEFRIQAEIIENYTS